MLKSEIVYISSPGPHDVLCGRGAKANNHEGNVLFRNLVKKHKMRYIAARKIDKPHVAREVVKIWKNQMPPGRFLIKNSTSDDVSSDSWYVIDDSKAREKTSQCLRERTPEVITFVRSRQIRRKKEKEENSNKDHSSNKDVAVDERSVPVDSEELKLRTSEQTLLGENLGIHGPMQLWQHVRDKKTNVALHNTAARHTEIIIPDAKFSLAPSLTTKMCSGRKFHGLQNFLMWPTLHEASQAAALKHSLSMLQQLNSENIASNASHIPILKPNSSATNPIIAMNAFVAQPLMQRNMLHCVAIVDY